MKDRVSEVMLEISPAHEIVRIVIQGVDEATTDFRFTNIEENMSLPDSLFRFEPPPGVAVITDNQVVQ
jgi:outer membrane lipoprotein-sorting protein